MEWLEDVQKRINKRNTILFAYDSIFFTHASRITHQTESLAKRYLREQIPFNAF